MTIRNNYEVSSPGAERHWEVPYARLENGAPTETQPAKVTAQTIGQEMTGTILTIDATNSIALIDFTHSMVYRHLVRNVATYNAGAENTWAAINEGDVIYYDGSATMPADCFLSLSPLDNLGAANPIFGHAVRMDETDGALFPKGAGGVASTQANVGVMQEGA